MGYKIDLTGKRFGKLTVLEFSHNVKRKYYWKCKCECGKEILAAADSLKTGNTQSCGCLAHINRGGDLTNKRFGSLTALYYIGNSKWHCKCDCGNETDVRTTRLIHGETKSCSHCSAKESGKARLLDLTGKKFGSLYVVEYVGKQQWRCRCDCGKEKIVIGSNLLGTTHSCGCNNIALNGSYPENEIRDFIYSFIPSKDVILHDRSCLDGKEIDMYVPSLKLGIEYNGSLFHASENGLYQNKDKYYHRDKFLLARSKGTRLINIFDIDYEANKMGILGFIKTIINTDYMFLPHNNIEYTNNDYDIGTWIKNFGYEEVGQEEPTSFLYQNKYLVYRCGRTIWEKVI